MTESYNELWLFLFSPLTPGLIIWFLPRVCELSTLCRIPLKPNTLSFLILISLFPLGNLISIHQSLPSLFLRSFPPITSVEPFGPALSPHECLIRPFELLYYSTAQNYLLFLSFSQLIKKGKVLPYPKKAQSWWNRLGEQMTKTREGRIKAAASGSLEALGIYLCA